MLDARANPGAPGDDAASAPHRSAPTRQQYSVAPCLSRDDILLDVDATTREQVFARVAELLEAHHGLRKHAVVAGLAEREELGSTALGQGVALPHARLKGVARPIAAFVRPRFAIPCDAPDGKPVSSLLILLVPEGATDAHLELLAQAASMFCDKAFRERLNRCGGAAEIVATFAGWQSA